MGDFNMGLGFLAAASIVSFSNSLKLYRNTIFQYFRNDSLSKLIFDYLSQDGLISA